MSEHEQPANSPSTTPVDASERDMAPEVPGGADVFYEGDSGVAMPGWTGGWEEAHYEVIESEYVAYNRQTGEYMYNIPLPEHVADRLNSEAPDMAEDDEEFVVENGEARLKGRVKSPHSMAFRLAAVEVLPAAEPTQ